MGDRQDRPIDVAGLLEAARLVRGRLSTLVGPTAGEVDSRLAELLQSPDSDQDVAVRVETVLRVNAATAGFTDLVLADAPRYRPPEMQESIFRGDMSRLAGDPGPIGHAGRYRCLRGDFVWYRSEIGAPVPDCPSHGSTLARDD